MKAFKFLRGLFGSTKKEKKDRREEEMRKEKMRTEREKQLFDLIEEMEEDFRWFEERNRRKALDRRRKKMEMEMGKKERKESSKPSASFFNRGDTSSILVPKWLRWGIYTRICGSSCHQPRIGLGGGRWSSCSLLCNGNKFPL